jgi:hypothetical protein
MFPVFPHSILKLELTKLQFASLMYENCFTVSEDYAGKLDELDKADRAD